MNADPAEIPSFHARIVPHEFLQRWKAEHIDSGTQQADSSELAESLMAEAAGHGLNRKELEATAGKSLESFIVDAVREAIEEELR